MIDNNLADYPALINYYLARARDLLTTINPNKRALYWSNDDTFYMKYKDQDVLVFWGASTSI